MSKERRRRKIRVISWKTFAGGGRRHFVRSEKITDEKFNLGIFSVAKTVTEIKG